jgi:release factor glutamine methyltransferase
MAVLKGAELPLMTARSAFYDLRRRFTEARLPTPEIDAKALVLHACGLSPEAYFLDPNVALNAAQVAEIKAHAHRRLAREPVSRILGRREFWGLDFEISPDVLDPRPDTETIIEAALDLLEAEGGKSQPLRILDLGTGSGCILLALLHEFPEAFGVGVDMSLAALSLAKRNAQALSLDERTAFLCADWGEGLNSTFDLIVSNPPYIPSSHIAALEPEVKNHDPPRALDGAADGLAAYRAIAPRAARLLKADGWLLLEAGCGQADDIAQLFVSAPWSAKPRYFRDLGGINRVVALKRQSGVS